MISKISRLVLFRSRGVPIRGSVWARRVTRRVGSLLGAGIKLFGGVAVVVMSTMPSHVWANPAGEQVVGGAAAFNRPDAATLIVNQNTDRAVINWNSFSIANGELTRFVQPNSSSAVLNRVVTANPSSIYGTLQANGNVYLINPGGVLVGAGGVLNTASFVASTHDIGTEEFMKGGQLNFKGNSDASVVNQGNITARDGDVFLIAKEVKNEGQLMAKDGTVGMVSGTEVSLQAVGQGNYKVRLMAAEKPMTENGGQKTEGSAEIVNEGVIQAANAVLEAKGSYLPMAIKNTGVIEATGLVENGDGSVTLTGGGGDILNTGVVAALQRSLDGQKETGGTIEVTGQNILLAPESIMTAAGADGGGKIRFRAGDMTLVAGSLEVTGRSAQAKGGRVELLGENVGLVGQARVNADGGAGGGTVLVGGDYLGRNSQIANAQNVVMGPEAVISADAKIQGDGGKVVLWSDQYTGFYGTIFAQGGLEKGNGGFVETSSKINLQAFGSGGAGAPNGEPGLWLLDPVNVEIVSTIPGGLQYQNGIFDYVTPTGVQRGWIFSPGILPTGTGAVPAPGSQILASFISGRLNGTSSLGPNNVAITTENPDPTNIYDGDITVSAGITWNQSTTLRLRADDDIFINAPISGTGGAVLELFSQQSGFDAGDVGIATQTANIVVDNLLLNGLGDGTLLNQDNNFNVLAGQDLFGTIGVRETGGFEIGTVTAGSVDGFAFTSVTDPLTGTIVYAVSGSSINATTANGIAFIRNRQNQDGSLVFPDPNLVLTSTGGITQTQPILVSAVVTVPVPTSPTSAFSLNVTSLNNDGGEGENILLNNSGNDADFVSLRTLSANGTVTSDADIRFDDADGFRITGPGMSILSAGGVITIAPTDGSVAGGVITSLGTISSATDTGILGGGNIVLSAGRSDTFTGAVLNGVVDQLDDPLAPSFIQGARIGFLGNPIEYNLFGATVGASNDIQRLTAYLTEGGNLNYEDSNGFQIMSLDFRNGEAQAAFIPGVRLAGLSDLAGLGNLRLVTRTGTEFNGIRLAVPQGPINVTDGGQLLNGFITAATQYFTLTQFTTDRSPGHIEATGSVEIVVKNGTETANPNLNTRFTMDEATHIFSGMVDDLSGWVGVNGVSGTVNGSGVAIVANNIVLGADTLPWLTNHGLIMTSPYGGTVSFQPWGNSGIDDVFANNGNLFRSIQIVSPKADYAQIPDPGFFQLTQSELRRINAARVVLSSSESTVGTPAIEVRSPLNLYGLYADTSISGIFPNNPGYNRIEMIATGAGTDPGVVVSADVSSDVNQKSLQMFFSSQDGRTVINGGLRSYGGDIGIQGQLIDLGGAINASSTGLVALLPGQAGRGINLGQKDDLNALGLLRSEIALITAGTVQIGSLPTFAYPTVLEPNSPQLIQILDPATGLKIGNYLGTNPLWSFNTVDAGAISITDSFARLSLDTMALVTSAGITQDPGAGLELPGLFVVGAPALGTTDYLLGGNLNRVDRLAVALADTTEEGIPTGDLLFVNQKGLIGGNGGEVARKQQQWTESLTRSTTTPATYTGVGLVVANALSISAKGSVGIYEIMPAGLTGLGYIGHVAANPNVANEVAASNVGNQIGRVGRDTSGLAIDATENELGSSGANTVFVAAARGLSINDLTFELGVDAKDGILNNGGTVTIEGNAIEIAGSVDRLSGEDITIDTTGDGVAPAGGRVVIRPATGLNGFQNRAGSGAFDYNLQNSPLAGAPVEMRFGLNTIDGINALTGAPGQFLDAGYDTVFLSATALSGTAIRGSTVEIGRNSDISTATGKFTLMASLGIGGDAFSSLMQNLSLISGGAVETSDNMAGGITLTVDGGLAVQANGTVGLVGDIDQLAVDAAGGTENLRFIDTAAGMTIGTVEDVVGLLATTVYLQSNDGGIAQAAGATIQAASGGIALRATGSIRLDQENDFNLAAAFAGTDYDDAFTWQPIYLRTAGPLTVSTFGPGQPGGQPFPAGGPAPFANVPAGVVGIRGSNVSLVAGGDLVQSDLAVIRADDGTGGGSFLATVLDGSDVVLASTANELGVNPIIAALKTDGTLGSIANLEIKTAGDVALGDGGILVVDLIGAGSGYTSAPTLTVNGVATTDLVPILGLQSIAISSGGQGYQQAPEVKISGGGGVGAQAVAIVDENPLSETFGQVIRITVTNAGTGYTGNVNVTLTGGGFTEAATDGTITLGLQRINVVDPNPADLYFSTTPTIGFIGGGGSGATATATIGGTGGLVLSGTTTVIGGITGNLILQTAGNITNGSGLAVGGTTTLSAGNLLNPSSINLNSANNNLVGAIQVTSFGDTTINNANSLALGNFTVGGNLVLGSRGNIYQESTGAALVVTGTSDFYATSTAAAGGTPNGVVILNNTRNDFIGPVTAQGTRIAIRATGNLDLGAMVASQSLTASSLLDLGAGTITMAGFSGTGSVALNAAVDVILTGAMSLTGPLSIVGGNNVDLLAVTVSGTGSSSVTAGGTINLYGNGSYGGSLSLSGGGAGTAINQDVGTSLTVAGASNFTSTAGGEIVLVGNGQNNFKGTVILNQTTGDISLNNGQNLLTLGSSVLGSGTIVFQTGGGITQGSGTTIESDAGGLVTFNAGAGVIMLVGAGNNNLAGTVNLSNTGANNVELTNGTNPLTLGNFIVGSGASTINAVGITQLVGTVASQEAGAGAATFNAGNGLIDLVGGGNNDFTGTLNLANGGAFAVTVTDANGISLGQVNIGTGAFSLTANTAGGAGTISQSQAFTIQGATTLEAGALGTIDLGLANTFAAVTVISARNVTLGNQAPTAGTALYPALPGIPDSLNNLSLIFNNSPVTLPQTTLTGTLSVVAGGLIQQSGVLDVDGSASFQTGAFGINLNLNNDFSSSVSLSNSGANPVALNNINNLILGTVTMGSGTLTVTTSNDNITQTGSLVLTGNASFSAGTGNITLNNTGNDFGNVQVIGNNVTLVDRTGLSFTVPSTIAGTLSVTAGGDVLWDNTAGNSAGLVTIASTGDVDVILGAGQGGVGQPGELGPIQASGTFTLQSPDTINLNSGGGGVDISTTQLQKLTVGSLVVDSGADINLGDFSSLPGIPSVELVAAVNINGNGVIGVNGLSLTAGGSANFSAVNQVANLGQITTGGGGFTFRNGQGLSITAPITVTGNVDLRVAGQFYNQSGSAQPFGGTTGSVTVRSLSLAGGLPNLISGLAGFSVGYSGQNPGGSRAMIYAVSPLTMFAPSGTFIAGIPGIDLGGTQTGGGQLNTFLTGSDNLNWMISDFGRFDMPTVKPSGMDYILYPQRVEPETKTLPAATLGQLERELGRPPTLDEIQAREVAVREAAIVRSGAILERTSFDAVEDEVDKQESAEVPVQVIDGGKPQAGGPSVAPNPLSGGAMEGFEPQARKTQSVRQGANGPILRSGPIRSVAQLRPAEPSQSGNISEASAQALKLDAKSVIEQERASAEVGIAPPIAAGR